MKIYKFLKGYTINDGSTIDFCGCGDGWKPLLKKMLDEIEKIAPEDYIISDIKEKLGGLRVYDCNGNERIDELVSNAEEEAEKTCELCGNSGELKSTNGKPSGWLKVLCNKCAKEMGYENI